MFKRLLRTWLLAGTGFLWGSLVHAEGGCPPGSYPIGDPSIAACAPIPGYGNQHASQPPAPQWEPRWGAIATDGKQWAMGEAVGKKSQLEAAHAAMADCQSKGGANCKTDVTYANQCAAVVAGDGGYNVSPALTVDEAVSIGMKTCTETGDKNCRTYYTTCSFPIRIR